MGGTGSSHRRHKRRGSSGEGRHSYLGYSASQHSALSAGHQHQHQQHQQQQQVYNHRYPSTDTYSNTMASSSSQRRNSKAASSRTLLDKKCVFLGRYYARQFSQTVLQRLRQHVQRTKGTKTRIRLSTKGLTVGSKNTNIFRTQKAPYEFCPLDDIHEVFVDNELRSVLLVIKGLPDGHLELLTYKMTDELEARLYQQTFNEMVAMRVNRNPVRSIETALNTMPSSGGGPPPRAAYNGNHANTMHYSSGGTLNSHYSNPTKGHRAGSSWTRTQPQPQQEAHVYRLKGNDVTDGYGTGTPASRRARKGYNAGNADPELRKQMEDREFIADMRNRGELRDENDNNELDDGPIRLVFNREGVLETHGAASLFRDGENESFMGSDHESIQESIPPALVDSGLGTVRAQVNDYRDVVSQRSSSRQRISSSDTVDGGGGGGGGGGHYANGLIHGGVAATNGHTSRSPTRSPNQITHHVYADTASRDMHIRRMESPAPSHQSRTVQSEGGWRMPWKRRSRSTDSQTGGDRVRAWDTTSLMVGSHARPAGRMYFPDNRGKNQQPPEFLVMYPTLNKNHRTKSKSVTRFEL